MGKLDTAGSPERQVRLRSVDKVLVAAFCVFAFTSFFMEPYITFGVHLSTASDPLGRLWHFYASRWDPLFLDPPPYLRVMTGVDEWVFGPAYLLLVYGFVRRRDWVRMPALLYCGAIIYSTAVYFLVEAVTQQGRADLLMVTVVNIPYTLVPCVLVWRVWRPRPFALSPRAADAGPATTGEPASAVT